MQIINHFRGEAHTLRKTLGVNVDLLFYYWFALFRDPFSAMISNLLDEIYDLFRIKGQKLRIRIFFMTNKYEGHRFSR
jgi:hypothetical protein